MKTNSASLLSAAGREHLLRLARQAVGRLLTEQTQRWQRRCGFGYNVDSRSAFMSREGLNLTPAHAQH